MDLCGNSSFWDWQQLSNSTWPRLPRCFQETVLVYLPAGFLWLAAPVHVAYLSTTKVCVHTRNTNLSLTKTIVSLLLTLITMAMTIKDVTMATESQDDPSLSSRSSELANEYSELGTAHYVARGVEIASFMFTAIMVQVERSYCVITSCVLFPYWMLLMAATVVPVYTSIELELYNVDTFRFVLASVCFLLIVSQFLLHCPSDVRLRGSSAYCNQGVCPEVTASFLSKLTFFWITKLILQGYKRPLQGCDVWPLNSRDKGETVHMAFSKAWNWPNEAKRKRRLSSKAKGDAASSYHSFHRNRSHSASHEYSPLLPSDQGQTTSSSRQSKRRYQRSLPWTLLKAFGFSVGVSYALKFVSDTLQFIGPFLLKELIVFIENRDSRPEWQGFFLSAAMLVTSQLQTLFYHQHYHLAMTAGLRMRSALMTAIYKKSLSMSNAARGRHPVGVAINLMSVDCQRIQDMMSYTWMVWSIPYQVSLAVYLLWGTLGAPVLAGLFLLLLLVPVNGAMAFVQQQLQRSNLMWKDRRLRMLSEVIAGIKVLKLYAWENSFLTKILNLRAKEVVVLTRLAWLNASGIFVWTCAPYLVSLASFSTFVMTSSSGVLTPDMAFVTLSLFNVLQFPIAFIPEMVSFAAQARVSLKRIQEYLSEEELECPKDKPLNNINTVKDPTAIRLYRATFTGDIGSQFRLEGLNIEIPRGSLVAVVGPVSSGKSAMLNALLGELALMQGEVSVNGSTAYVPQEAWLQNTTVRENILFGSTFNPKKYRKVIDSCALTSDLESMPNGDLLEIGEKGVNLSGGQRQRISLARAVYSDSDIYVLDDPLSALDTQVAKHVFKRVVSSRGCLKQKTRIFVTHGVHWLPLVDLVLVMQDGRLVESGPYSYLIGRDGPLAHFLFASLKRDMEDSETFLKGDAEVLEIKRRMWEHVESATSQSDATTSGDDVMKYRQVKLHNSGTSSISGGPSTPVSAVDVKTTSTGSNDTTDDKLQRSDLEPPPLEIHSDEHLYHGNVKLGVYKRYCENAGYLSVFITVTMFGLYQTCSVLANVWLSKWTSDQAYRKSQNESITSGDVMRINVKYLTIYGLLGAGQVLFIFIYACIASLRMVGASSVMHATMLKKVMGAPVRFFDSTPTGRLLNRFSRDVETLDNNLPQVFFMWIMCLFSVVATLVVVSVETPIFMAVVAPLLLGYCAIQRFFVPTSRQLKRLEAVTRSPVFTHFSETLTGSHVIRAYKRQTSFTTGFLNKLDKNIVMYFAGITANRWLGVWIEAVSSLVVMATSIFSLITPGINGATLGLSVTYALQITQALKWLVRSMSDIETNAVSVERVYEYSLLEQEASQHSDDTPSPGWPSLGGIDIRNLTIKYNRHLAPVINDLNCVIQPGEKVVIVGRTGAGKSTLTLALFRILEASQGHISIDGVNIADIGLHALRSRMTVLPQEPVILSGSLRMNLDPNNEYSDHELWHALTLAHLKDTVLNMADGLASDVGDNGARISMGHRQLVCLARALLRQSQILVMDEPTSCVDPETDSLVQDTVMTSFQHCTVITIAHRIQSVLNYDRVMVLDRGRIVEFDKPLSLLKEPKSVFATLARSAGYKHAHANTNTLESI